MRLLPCALLIAGLSAAQPAQEPQVLRVFSHAGAVEFESPISFSPVVPDNLPRGPYLGLSLAGSSLIQVDRIPGARAVPEGRLRGVSEPESAAPVLFVLWSEPLPAMSLRMASAVSAGTRLRVIVPRASGPQTWLLGPEHGWDIAGAKSVGARVFVDGTTGLAYLLVSAQTGEASCPVRALLFDVSGELRPAARTELCHE